MKTWPIEDLTIDELLDLNQIICNRIDYLRTLADQEKIRQLHIGNTVSFESREGTIFGIVIKLNRKTVVVLSEDQRQWKVPPGMLTQVKEINRK